MFLLLFLQIFADALRANLIEYEERYELCKAENAETVQQLEKLSIDFDRLRASFEASKGSSIANATVFSKNLKLFLFFLIFLFENLKMKNKIFPSELKNYQKNLILINLRMKLKSYVLNWMHQRLIGNVYAPTLKNFVQQLVRLMRS